VAPLVAELPLAPVVTATDAGAVSATSAATAATAQICEPRTPRTVAPGAAHPAAAWTAPDPGDRTLRTEPLFSAPSHRRRTSQRRGAADAIAPGAVQVRRALLSVSDKRGIVEFARGLAELGSRSSRPAAPRRSCARPGSKCARSTTSPAFPRSWTGASRRSTRSSTPGCSRCATTPSTCGRPTSRRSSSSSWSASTSTRSSAPSRAPTRATPR
jgi:hypothetical protein